MYTKPKKSLGQNFLIDKNIRNKIINACGFRSCDTVLEIGSGRGELTALIAKEAGSVIATEIDSELCKLLKSSLGDHPNIEIINRDILKFNLGIHSGIKGKKIKVVGNIPYYISSPIIEHLLKFKDKIETIFITVQKEFGKRVNAKPGSKDYGSFSCFVQYYASSKILFIIKKNSFYPAPKVDSCFLRLDILDKISYPVKDEKYFFSLIRAAFNKRRKTLKNSLCGFVTRQKLELFFSSYKINPNIRPDDLSLSDFANLSNL